MGDTQERAVRDAEDDGGSSLRKTYSAPILIEFGKLTRDTRGLLGTNGFDGGFGPEQYLS